jgi:signal transduction histidine kinase
MEIHFLHQQLFFIPIVLTSFWFRMRAGLIIAVIISTIYLTTMLAHMSSAELTATIVMQVVLYLLIAVLIGWLTGRLKKQQEQAIRDAKSKSVTQLASALSYEIFDIVTNLEHKYQGSKPHSENDSDLNEEINKLKRLTRAFQRFSPLDEEERISRNINTILKDIRQKYQPEAKQLGVDIDTEFDQAGCTSMVISDSIIRLLEALVQNAMEASPPGERIILRSERDATHCRVEVEDHGLGVADKHKDKLFQPFFTTKQDGHGLTLAAGRKVIRDCGGDLSYLPSFPTGSIFRLTIPRESSRENIDGHIHQSLGY